MVMTIMMAIWAFECLFWFKMSGRAIDKERQEDEQGGHGQVGMEAEVEWWTDIYNGSRGGVEAEVKQWYDITIYSFNNFNSFNRGLSAKRKGREEDRLRAVWEGWWK